MNTVPARIEPRSKVILVLGFGGGGHELLKSYDVKYLGSETVDGVKAEKLELIPKSVQLRNNIARILLWIDPQWESQCSSSSFEIPEGGDYRLAKYSDIRSTRSFRTTFLS